MPNSPHATDRVCEWLLACLMLAWGIGLMLPGNTMELYNYRYLGAIAPEIVWTAWSLAIALIRLGALYVNGSHYRTPLVRAGCSMLGIIWWLVLGALFYVGTRGGPVPAALLWYPVLCGFEGYSVYRSAKDSYHSGALKKWQSRQATR